MLCLTPIPSLPACYTPPLLGLCLFWSEYSPDSSSICQCFQSVSLGSKRFPPHTHTHTIFALNFLFLFVCRIDFYCCRGAKGKCGQRRESKRPVGAGWGALWFMWPKCQLCISVCLGYTQCTSPLPSSLLSSLSLSLANCGCHLFMVWDWTVG